MYSCAVEVYHHSQSQGFAVHIYVLDDVDTHEKNRNPVDATKDSNMRDRIGGGLCLSIQLTSGRLSKLELELGKIQYYLLPKIILRVPSSSVTSVPLVGGDPYLEVRFQFSVDRYIYI